MPDREVTVVRTLVAEDEAAIEELLDEDRVVNLFLRGFIARRGVEGGDWYGVEVSGRLTGVVLLVQGQLMVPWAPDPEDAGRLGAWLARRHPPCMSVGPREAVDHIWDRWSPGARPTGWHAQRLYRLEKPGGRPDPGLRLAAAHEWALLAAHAARMEMEDLGRDPSAEDPEAHDAAIRQRIQDGRLWVLEEDGEIVFLVNVGTGLPDGVQLGGTYVPPRFRRRGYARRGMAAVAARLLPHHSCVTLHVHESNIPAVRCYEAVGFQPHAPYRLAVVGSRRRTQ